MVAQHPDVVGDALRGLQIEAGGGLVEEQHPGIGDQGAQDHCLLLHSGGKAVGAPVDEVLHREHLDAGVEIAPDVPVLEAVQSAEEEGDLARRHALVNARLVRHHADQTAHLLLVVAHRQAADVGAAGGGLDQGREDAQQRGLAGAVGSQESVDRARGAGEGHPVESGDPALFLRVVDLGELSSFNHGGSFRQWSERPPRRAAVQERRRRAVVRRGRTVEKSARARAARRPLIG